MAPINSNGAGRAVLYLRMSSAKQDKSIPAQRHELTALAKRQGYSVVREYVDAAVSGDDNDRRTGFLKLREDAETLGDFGIILVWDQDRLSRNDPLEIGYWLKPIRDAGIVVETPQGRVDWETLGGRLVYLISQEMKHEYLRSLSRNIVRGQLNASRSAPRGTGGTDPSGYLRVDGKAIVDEALAPVIRLIFTEYDKPGASLRSVANILNQAGYVTKHKKRWTVKTVQRVLQNQKYVGDFVRFKYRTGKYHCAANGEVVPRSKSDKKEQTEPVVIADHHEPLVERELFERVQRKLPEQRKRTARRIGYQYVFSGLIRCGDCNGSMRGVPARHDPQRKAYQCSTYTHSGRSACFHNQINEDALLDVVVRKIQERYLSEDSIERLRSAIQDQQRTEERRDKPVDLRSLRKRVEALDQQIDRGAERIFTAPDSLVPTLSRKLDEIRGERDRLQAQLDAVARQENRPREDQVREVEDALSALHNLREALSAGEPREVRELIGSLVSRIELEFSHKTVGKITRSTLERGTIWVRPEPALGSLLCPSSGQLGGSAPLAARLPRQTCAGWPLDRTDRRTSQATGRGQGEDQEDPQAALQRLLVYGRTVGVHRETQ